MTRKQYLLKQKEKGRYLMGVFPALYPKELLWAMNMVPAEIWDPPLDMVSAGAHLQPTICPVVRLGLELILKGECDFLDGFLFPHTCDSIQNLASLVKDQMNTGKPCFFFYHPKAPYGPAARDYYRENLKRLARSLEERFGPLDPVELRRSIEDGRTISGLLGRIYSLREKGKLNAGNREFYNVIRRSEYLFPEDLIAEFNEFLAGTEEKERLEGTPVIMSGILPNPPEILTLLDDLGVRVAQDDLLVAGRRLMVPGNDMEDPFDRLTEAYFPMPPCSTRGSSISRRIEHLFRLIDASEARGVIFNVVKFCEPEWFDVPGLQEELKKRGVPSLVLDTELNQGLSGQTATRVEAFVEMLD